MKFQEEKTTHFTIVQFDADSANAQFTVEGVVDDALQRHTFRQSTYITHDGSFAAWRPAEFAEVELSDLEAFVALKPEVVLLGSGARTHPPKPEWMKLLYAHGIGLESMATAAAYRTYNILVGEGRRVVGAFLL